ncbi:MAG: NAD(P)H-quinone oxidoreductase [Burkholderiaceae bacterium]
MFYIDHGQGGGPEVLRAMRAARPTPAADEVLIEVAYAGVNRPDCAQRIGRYLPPADASPVLGLEVAGRVVAVGADVGTWQPGDLVCALTPGGAYAEYCVAPAAHCLPVPDGWSLEAAACLPEALFTVWDNVFRRARLRATETVLVHGGSGGVGNAAVQLARAMGATVIATAGSQDKATRCLAIGAHHAIDYRTEDFVARAMDITGGRGVDVVNDMVAGPYIARDLEALALDGRIALIAFMGGARAEIDVLPILRKRATITGSTLRPCSRAHKAAIAADLRAQVWPLLRQGLCKPQVERVLPLAAAADAHRLMESGAHFGKIVLRAAAADAAWAEGQQP